MLHSHAEEKKTNWGKTHRAFENPNPILKAVRRGQTWRVRGIAVQDTEQLSTTAAAKHDHPFGNLDDLLWSERKKHKTSGGGGKRRSKSKRKSKFIKKSKRKSKRLTKRKSKRKKSRKILSKKYKSKH